MVDREKNSSRLLLLETTCKTQGTERELFHCDRLAFPLEGDQYCFRCGQSNTCEEYARLAHGIAKTFMPLLLIRQVEDKAETDQRQCFARASRPVFLSEVNLDELRGICENYLDDVEKGLPVRDYDGYISEAALVALYGEDVFQWIKDNEAQNE